jgi:hypothetical protein
LGDLRFTFVENRFAMSVLRLEFASCSAFVPRRAVVALFVGLAVWAIGSPANAGIVTSMHAGACESISDSPPQADRAEDQNFCITLRRLLERSPTLEGALPTSTSTFGGVTGNSFGPTHPPMAFADACDAEDFPARGWVAPETTLALPPLLPSGLFRPPRNTSF